MSADQDPEVASVKPLDPAPAVRFEGVWASSVPREQGPSLLRAFEAGVAAAILGAIIWAAVQMITGYQIGWMAVGVGFLVGYAVRRFGQGSSPAFGIVGAALALFGIVLGNLLAVCGYLMTKESVALFTSIGLVFGHPSVTAELLKETCGGMNLLFCAIALFEGYRFSILAPRTKRTASPAAQELPGAPTPPAVPPTTPET